VSKPLSLYVDTHGTGTVGDDKIEAAIMQHPKLGGLTPRAIRTHLGLNKPIYRKTAAYGHFGRKPDGRFLPVGTHRSAAPTHSSPRVAPIAMAIPAPATGSSPGRRAARGS
jgi:hypothetical protein